MKIDLSRHQVLRLIEALELAQESDDATRWDAVAWLSLQNLLNRYLQKIKRRR